MKFLGRFIKYLLRSLFSIIIFLLFMWLAKMNWDTGAYISFLNSNDRSVFHWSQPATWSDPFWSNTYQWSWEIADMFSNDTWNDQLSGLDVYDPSFEEDLNSVSDGSLSDSSGQDFWFTTDEQPSSGSQISSGTTSRDQLLNVIQNSPNVQK